VPLSGVNTDAGQWPSMVSIVTSDRDKVYALRDLIYTDASAACSLALGVGRSYRLAKPLDADVRVNLGGCKAFVSQ
jgi:hypothetical protein